MENVKVKQESITEVQQPVVPQEPPEELTSADMMKAAEEQQAVQPEQSAPIVGQQFDVPEKFRGKDWNTVARSALEAEKLAGTKAEEARRLKEELEQLKAERQVQPQQSAVQSQQPVQSNPIEEINDLFRKEWEVDPVEAEINRTNRIMYLQNYQSQAAATVNKYNSAMNDEVNYPGFKTLEPKMKELAGKYVHLLNPTQINSPETIDILYKLARVDSLKEHITAAKVAGVTEAHNLQREKTQAFGEGSSPAGDRSVPLTELTSSEIEKQYGFLEK